MAISAKEELQFLLHRGWEIEKKFESMSRWKAFVAVESAYRKTILTLARDLEHHRLILEKLLQALDLEAPANEVFGDDFDFTSKHDIGILREIAKQDEAAKDFYTELIENTDPKLVASLSSEGAVKLFYGTLTQLVKDEERHIKMVRNLAGDVKGVQPTRI